MIDPKTDPDNLGRRDRLQDAIKAAGLTTAEVARLLDVSPHTLQAWLYGKRIVPRWAEAALAEATGNGRELLVVIETGPAGAPTVTPKTVAAILHGLAEAIETGAIPAGEVGEIQHPATGAKIGTYAMPAPLGRP